MDTGGSGENKLAGDSGSDGVNGVNGASLLGTGAGAGAGGSLDFDSNGHGTPVGSFTSGSATGGLGVAGAVGVPVTGSAWKSSLAGSTTSMSGRVGVNRCRISA